MHMYTYIYNHRSADCLQVASTHGHYFAKGGTLLTQKDSCLTRDNNICEAIKDYVLIKMQNIQYWCIYAYIYAYTLSMAVGG